MDIDEVSEELKEPLTEQEIKKVFNLVAQAIFEEERKYSFADRPLSIENVARRIVEALLGAEEMKSKFEDMFDRSERW